VLLSQPFDTLSPHPARFD